MANSKDVNELASSWKEWHEKTGRPLRSKFIRYVELSNEAARLNGSASFYSDDKIASFRTAKYRSY